MYERTILPGGCVLLPFRKVRGVTLRSPLTREQAEAAQLATFLAQYGLVLLEDGRMVTVAQLRYAA